MTPYPEGQKLQKATPLSGSFCLLAPRGSKCPQTVAACPSLLPRCSPDLTFSVWAPLALLGRHLLLSLGSTCLILNDLTLQYFTYAYGENFSHIWPCGKHLRMRIGPLMNILAEARTMEVILMQPHEGPAKWKTPCQSPRLPEQSTGGRVHRSQTATCVSTLGNHTLAGV